jgi:hypothetical protein
MAEAGYVLERDHAVRRTARRTALGRGGREDLLNLGQALAVHARPSGDRPGSRPSPAGAGEGLGDGGPADR